MNIEIISTEKAPAAIGPYSQAVKLDGRVYTSGQIPINPQTGEVVVGDIKAQTTRALENLKAVLSEAGTSLNNVIKTTVFLKDMKDFAEMNKIYGEYFTKPISSKVMH